MMTSPSLMLDSRVSIEHQIDIHVNDLAEWVAESNFKPVEILEGLRYLMEYRIKNGRLSNMDYELAKRLLQVLLINIKKYEKKSKFAEMKPKPEAILALEIFGQFLTEVHEFREAAMKLDTSIFRHSLNPGLWAGNNIPPKVRELAAAVISLICDILKTHGISYEEIFKKEDLLKVQKLLEEFSNNSEREKVKFTLDEEKVLYPIPRLYTERNALKVVASFGSDVDRGLDDARVEEHRKVYGINKLDSHSKTPWYKMVYHQLKDFMVMILIIMSIVEFSTGSYDSGLILMVVILFNTIVGFYLEYVASQAMTALFKISAPLTNVIRNGVVFNINSEELVPGDIVLLDEGSLVPADIRLIECHQLKVNEAFLTGENIPVSKDPHSVTGRRLQLPITKCKCSLFMSTTITSGRAKGVVVRIGNDTEIGSIGTVLQVKVDKKSRLQKELKMLGVYLVVGALVLCTLNVIILISYRKPVINSIKVSVTLAVSVIPEGLVAIVTGTMFIAMRRMAKKNAIVKNMHAVETLGSVTTICTDKTGTLTRGKMTLDSIYTTDNIFYQLDPYYCDRVMQSSLITSPIRYFTPTLDNSHPQSNNTLSNYIGENTPSILDTGSLPPVLNLIATCASLCNTASLAFGNDDQTATHTGDPTEIALLAGSLVLGISRESIQKHTPYTIVTEFSFDSDRKMMSVICSMKTGPMNEDIQYFVFAKGASEVICLKCDKHFDAPKGSKSYIESLTTFSTKELTTDYINTLEKYSSLMANEGNRVLALAYKRLKIEEVQQIIDNEDSKTAESNLTFLGFVGLKDPPRPEIKSSIEKCENAGIRVIVITGDHGATAISIAKQVGIFDPNVKSKSMYMRGENLSSMSEDRIKQLPIFPVVFSRASPADKLKIVKSLQSLNEVVSMIGDGVNDAPSIKMSNIGISMALTGTEITKQAADIVLSDDNIKTVISAIEEGRRVYDNIHKFLAYLISCNAAEIILFLVTSILNYDAPFLTIQILWANIIADIPPAMSIGVEPAENGLMERLPRPQNQKLIDAKTASIMLIQSLIIAIPSFIVFAYANKFRISNNQTLAKRRTLSFACLMTLQMTQSLLSRSVFRSVFSIGILGNKFLIWSFFLSTGLMFIGIYVPGIQTWLMFEPFHPYFWFIILGFVVIQFITVEVVRLLFNKFLKPPNIPSQLETR